jgi:peroxiredoxin
MKEVQTIFEGQDAKKLDFVKSHPTSWVTPMYLAQLQYNMRVQELDSILTTLDPKLAVVPSVVSMKEQVEKLKKVAVGETAPDFTMNDPEGNPVKLSDVYAKNKYTLIDFWAAWCGPCRQENPNIVATYAKFNSKGFGILGVSLDQDRDRWLKAIEDDKLTWTQVSDLQYWQNQAAGMYGINSIPANYLVDQTGKIIGHNLRGEELGNKLAELLP